MVDIFCDETKGPNSKFQILTFIWGETQYCHDFQREVEEKLSSNASLFNLQTFHASKVRNESWNKKIWAYRWLLVKLRFYVATGRLNVFSYFESKEKIDRNSRHIFDIIDRATKDRNHPLGKIFLDVPEEILPVISQRSHRLYYLMKFRDKFGSNTEQFNFYPDSSGKVLNHLQDIFPVHGNVTTNPREIQEIINRLANSLITALESPSMPESDLKKGMPNQSVNIFQPRRDEDSFLIQSADVINNFLFGALQFAFGKEDLSTQLKHHEVTKLFDGQTFESIKSGFGLEPLTKQIVPTPNLRGMLEFPCVDVY